MYYFNHGNDSPNFTKSGLVQKACDMFAQPIIFIQNRFILSQQWF